MQILFKWKSQKHLNEKLPWKLPFYLHWLFEDWCRHSGTWNQRSVFSRKLTKIFRAVWSFFCQRRMPLFHWIPTLTLRRLMPYIYGAPILDVSRSHTTTQHSRYDSSGRETSSSQRPLPDNTRHSQQTNIHAPGGIRTQGLSRRVAGALACWDRGFEFHRGHGYLSVVSVVCCQVEVSATNWSLVQRNPTNCAASLFVI